MSINPGLNDQVGGEETGDVAGEKKVGDGAGEILFEVDELLLPKETWLSKSMPNMSLEDDFGCKICGKLSQTRKCHNEHLVKKHSKGAIDIATEVVMKNHVYAENNPKHVLCLISYVLCPMSYVLCHMSYVLCIMSYVLCPMSYVLCLMSYVLY